MFLIYLGWDSSPFALCFFLYYSINEGMDLARWNADAASFSADRCDVFTVPQRPTKTTAENNWVQNKIQTLNKREIILAAAWVEVSD